MGIAAPAHWNSFRLRAIGAAEIIRKLAELLQRGFQVGHDFPGNHVRFRKIVREAIP